MIKFIQEVLEGAWSLIVGMSVTFRYFFKKPVTVIYPKERVQIKRFKGPIFFVNYDKPNDANADHKCIACNACIKTCPSRCMSLVAAKTADGKRVPSDFKVNYMLCSLCSLCIDVCPTDALQHATADYDMVASTQKEMHMDLMKPFRDKHSPLTQLPPQAPPVAKPAAPSPPAGQTEAT